MYGALWRILPGPWWVRLFLLLMLIAAVLAACLYFVFPWLNGFINVTDVTVDG
ncbi:hypothetical protein [Marisediminicola senii]|uniref:hypothetical protein n=1 Tax=Marisediminicola senii TaxID=2711233 RepID=UPI0013ED48AC|nr:hypothetical protein [Marisediminicola senii]